MHRPFEPGIIQPGMDRVIEAGNTLIIEDANGQEFAVKAIESEEMLNFLKAFDEWNAASKLNPEAVLLSALWRSLITAFNNLPMEVLRQLPSFKSLGMSVSSH